MAHGCISSHASGAPSEPCLGAFFRDLRRERIVPIGRNRKAVVVTREPCRFMRAPGIGDYSTSRIGSRANWHRLRSNCYREWNFNLVG